MDLRELKIQQGTARHPWETARTEVIKILLKDKTKLDQEKPLRILDLGCGDIYLVSELAKGYPNIEFYAVDIAFEEDLLAMLQANTAGTKISVYRSLKDIEGKLDAAFDMVFLFDVIEHIEDDIAFLKDLQTSSLIAKDTVFFITVPAYQSLFAQHDIFLGHYRRYTNKMLREHLDRAGLITMVDGYFFFTLIWFRILELIKEKIMGANAQGVASWNGGPFFTAFLRGLLVWDFKISNSLRKVGFKLPGLSNYILCVKK